MRPEDSFLERLSERDRRDSEITPGTLDGQFWVLYQFPGEALRETRNRTVHGFICTALVSCPNGYRLYWGVYVRRRSEERRVGKECRGVWARGRCDEKME